MAKMWTFLKYESSTAPQPSSRFSFNYTLYPKLRFFYNPTKMLTQLNVVVVDGGVHQTHTHTQQQQTQTTTNKKTHLRQSSHDQAVVMSS